MRAPLLRLAPALAALTVAVLPAAGATAQQTSVVGATETLFISAGCPQSTPGTCTSTRWLGKTPGTATSNFLTSTTPVDEVLYRADGSLNWRDYASDQSLRDGGYPLRADQPLDMAVRVTSNALAAQATVHTRIEAVTSQGDTVTFGPLQKPVNLVGPAEQVVTFAHDIPAELDGVALESLTAFVAVHGVNAQGGYIDQAGGSKVTVPYWVSTSS